MSRSSGWIIVLVVLGILLGVVGGGVMGGLVGMYSSPAIMRRKSAFPFLKKSKR